jgi:diadenylate cyclase
MKIKKIFGTERQEAEMATVVAHTVAACEAMSRERIGALIVFARDNRLDEHFKTGTVIDAQAASYMIKNIFFNKAPMHDGALIIRNNRLYAAGCILPLSYDPELIKDLVTRHRASIGMSENSDAVVVVVSEETGTVSIAVDGHLTRDYDAMTLKRELVRLIFQDQSRSNTQDTATKGGAEQ